jgi:RNA polymerase primary sigma factor
MTRRRQTRLEAVHSPMETYLHDINETPLLTAEEEKQLAYRINDGDCQARDYMVRANLRLVVNIARGYTGRGLSLQDLIAEGNMGLMRAVEGFDPSRNIRFSTYASYWIKQSIKRGLINTGKTVRLPAYMVELLSKWRRATNRLHDLLGRPPTEDEIAAELKLPRKKLTIIKKAIRVYSAASQAEQPEDGTTLDDLLQDSTTRRPDAELARSDELGQVLNLLDTLEPREAQVIRLRFGLSGEEPKTLNDIGARLNLTRERVRQIETEALRKLREHLQGE